MKKAFALILAAVILMTIAACGETPQNDASQNEPGEPSRTLQIDPAPGISNPLSSSLDAKGNSPSLEIELNENEKTEIESIINTDNMPQSDPAPQSPSLPESPVIPQPTSETSSKEGEKNNAMPNISITVGGAVFSAKLYDNDTARALLKQFPMTLNMSELNGNEKYYYLSDNLPADSQRVGNIHTGDLMLYGSDCLVLFYESFSTSYNYTKLGYIEDAPGLAAALGSGGVEVAFAVGN